ncbi:MAG: hypothetical protein ABSF34_13850, partial [Verrucomicrobiota bacterium]
DYTEAIEFKPNTALFYSNRGFCEFLRNDFDGAIHDASRAIELDSNDADAYSTRGWASYGKGDLAGALQGCKKAAELEGMNSLGSVTGLFKPAPSPKPRQNTKNPRPEWLQYFLNRSSLSLLAAISASGLGALGISHNFHTLWTDYFW